MRHGWPIGVGYFGVAFALGIAARNAGFSALQAGVMSAVCTASAGEFAGVTVAAASGTFLEMALIELVDFNEAALATAPEKKAAKKGTRRSAKKAAPAPEAPVAEAPAAEEAQAE